MVALFPLSQKFLFMSLSMFVFLGDSLASMVRPAVLMLCGVTCGSRIQASSVPDRPRRPEIGPGRESRKSRLHARVARY